MPFGIEEEGKGIKGIERELNLAEMESKERAGGLVSSSLSSGHSSFSLFDDQPGRVYFGSGYITLVHLVNVDSKTTMRLTVYFDILC